MQYDDDDIGCERFTCYLMTSWVCKRVGSMLTCRTLYSQENLICEEPDRVAGTPCFVSADRRAKGHPSCCRQIIWSPKTGPICRLWAKKPDCIDGPDTIKDQGPAQAASDQRPAFVLAASSHAKCMGVCGRGRWLQFRKPLDTERGRLAERIRQVTRSCATAHRRSLILRVMLRGTSHNHWCWWYGC